MIKLQVIGNLGKDGLLNQVNGKNVINFTIAHTERYRDAGGNQKERTTWVECAYWTERTGVVPYLKKGSQVFVEGTPEVRQFTRTDGSPGASLSLRVNNLQLLGNKTEGGTGSGAYQPANATNAATVPHADDHGHETHNDDLPF
jgi:single-strand DNA-binding protein